MTDRTCPVCGDAFSAEFSLGDHCWDAHGTCHHCGTRFDDRDTLYAHLVTAHEGSLSSEVRARAVSVAGEPTFRDRLVHQGPVAAITDADPSRRALLGGSLVGLGGVLGATFLGGSSSDTPLEDHPAAAGLVGQPTLGPPPSEAEGTVIAYEDPSCPSCARFERTTFPRLEEELVDTERLSFVYRGIPVVHPWSEPAVLAMEAVYDRDTDAFWALKDHYYREQTTIGTDTVRDVTRRFLADRTDVDAAEVVADVNAGTFREAVDADLRASRDAGVRGTPTFFLFRDGSFTTEIVGPQSFDVFANSLGM